MTGLDKILEQIKKESDETVSKKLSEAKDRADSILEEAKKGHFRQVREHRDKRQ